MIVAIHQPNFAPWQPFFEKMRQADLFILLDCVDFSHNSRTNRARVFEKNRGSQWLTLPVKHGPSKKISELKIDNSLPWRDKHLNLLHASYSDSLKGFGKLYNMNCKKLVDYTEWSIHWIAKELDIQTKTITASSLRPPEHLHSNELLIHLLEKTGADTYLSGTGAPYMEAKLFEQAGIKIEYCTAKTEDLSALHWILINRKPVML